MIGSDRVSRAVPLSDRRLADGIVPIVQAAADPRTRDIPGHGQPCTQLVAARAPEQPAAAS